MSATKDDIKKGRDLIFSYNSTKVGRVISASLTVDGNTVDISDDDSGEWTEYIRGRKSWSMSLSAHNVEHVSSEAQGTINEDFIDGTDSGTVEFGPENATDGDVTYTGDVYVTNFTVDKNGSDEGIESSWEFQGTGALTRSVTTTTV